MNFDQLNKLPSSRIKALFGFKPEALAELLFAVLPELERRRTERLKKRANRKRRYGPNDGCPREVRREVDASPKSREQATRFTTGQSRARIRRITYDQYRLALGLFPMIASAVVGLIQFSRIVT